MVRMFTNRRRAKDALQVIDEKYGLGETSTVVFVMDGEVYIQTNERPDTAAILHFGAVVGAMSLDMERTTELYRGEEARRFRV